MRKILRQCAWLFGLLVLLISSSCTPSGPEVDVIPAANTVTTATEQVLPADTPVPATATQPPPTATLAPTATLTPMPSDTATPSATPTATELPPTPSGDQAIYIYLIRTGSGGLIKCGKSGDSVIPINTGLYRTGDVAADVATALRRLFVKRQWIAGLYNPAYLSNINVDSADFKPFQGIVSIRLSGTYVRSKDRCDNSRVRAQVWSTIRQFPGIKVIDILLNGNLLGDILSNR